MYKRQFQAIVEETLGDNCDFETVKNIHENLSELVEETKDEPVPLTLDKYQMCIRDSNHTFHTRCS